MRETVENLTSAKEIAEHTARILLSSAQYPEFGKKSVPVAVAADVFGKDVEWVQAGIINGWLPIGNATVDKKLLTRIEDKPRDKKANYYISPKLLWELTGYVWKGKEGQADVRTTEIHTGAEPTATGACGA